MNASNRFDILVHVLPGQMLLSESELIVDLIAGDLGATGLTLSAKVPEPQDAVALSADNSPSAIRMAPGAMFHPHAEQYTSTRLRALLSPTLKTRHPMDKIVEVARSRSIRVRLRLSALCDAAVVAKYPDIAGCNALGLAPSVHTLCPSNPDVVEWVRCQLVDLSAQFQPDGIELANVTAPGDFSPASGSCPWPACPGPVESALLAICFCPSCRQQAIHTGLDATLALRSVQVHLKHWLQNETAHPGTIADLLADDEILAQYVACQKKASLAAVQIWTRTVPNASFVLTKSSAFTPWNPSHEDLAAIAPQIILRSTPGVSLDQCKQGGTGPSAPQIEVAIDATSPAFAIGPDIVRCLGDLARSSVAGVVLENGLTVSPSRRPFIRQAIRLARRERNL